MYVADTYGRGGLRNGPNGCCGWGGSKALVYSGGGGMSPHRHTVKFVVVDPVQVV